MIFLMLNYSGQVNVIKIKFFHLQGWFKYNPEFCYKKVYHTVTELQIFTVLLGSLPHSLHIFATSQEAFRCLFCKNLLACHVTICAQDFTSALFSKHLLPSVSFSEPNK